MFKKKFAPRRTFLRHPLHRGGCILTLCALLFTTACRTVPLLPKADLSENGWTTFQGQAVWQANENASEIAGELLLATHREGRSFVQFTKTPFPFVIAQSTTNSWQIESPIQERIFSRRGSPPARVIWFQLPRAWSGKPLPERWSWEISEHHWTLWNARSGERLEGYLEPVAR